MAKQESKKFGEGTMELVRNTFVVIGVIGIVAAIAGAHFSVELIKAGAVGTAAGEGGRIIVSSGNK